MSTEDGEELRRLRRENRSLREEREISDVHYPLMCLETIARTEARRPGPDVRSSGPENLLDERDKQMNLILFRRDDGDAFIQTTVY